MKMDESYYCPNCDMTYSSAQANTVNFRCRECHDKLQQPDLRTITSTPSNPNLIECRDCSSMFSKRAAHCPKCGAQPIKGCVICQNNIPINSTSCPECGDPTPFKLQRASNTRSPSPISVKSIPEPEKQKEPTPPIKELECNSTQPSINKTDHPSIKHNQSNPFQTDVATIIEATGHDSVGKEEKLKGLTSKVLKSITSIFLFIAVSLSIYCVSKLIVFFTVMSEVDTTTGLMYINLLVVKFVFAVLLFTLYFVAKIMCKKLYNEKHVTGKIYNNIMIITVLLLLAAACGEYSELQSRVIQKQMNEQVYK